MARRFEVAVRLAEGREAVEHTQTYVSACRLRGYQHPDLTAHSSQVRDWYDGEDGLDLQLLGDDCARLWALADLAEEALRIQRAQPAQLAAAWSGLGGDAAAGFLRNHCESGAVLATGLRAAAQACEMLRDSLWRVIDDKVAAAVSIDDRTSLQRPLWLAAARTVPAGDPQAAEVIDQQVTPYVDGEISVEWLDIMRCARRQISAAYDAAIAEVAPGADVVFPIPGELGPHWRPEEPGEPMPSAAAVPVTPAAALTEAVGSPTNPPDPVAPVPPPEDPLPAPPDDVGGMPTDSGWPGGLGGLPAGAGGLGGLIPRIADALSGLLGSAEDGLTGPELDGPPDERLDDGDELDAEDELGDGDGPGEAETVAAETEPEPPADGGAGDAPTDQATAVPADQPVAAALPEVSVPENPEAEKTPCEIAADELPQVGQ